jgi:hypothetical protein
MREAIRHHEFALIQYQKAIKIMRNAIIEGEHDIRIALVSCIIIACFESLHGNPEGSSDQVIIGLALLKDWHSSYRGTGKAILGFSSPDPYNVEDFLVQTFGHMGMLIGSLIHRFSGVSRNFVMGK